MLRTWTKKELNTLRKNYPTISNPRDIVPMLCNKSYKAMKTKARVLGLKRLVDTPRENTDTPETVKYLQDHYLTTNVNQMSIAVKRSETYVKGAMKRLGLVQPPELIEKFKQESYIKPGNVSFNKGKKQSDYMSEEMIARTVKTRFKKGNRPPNEQEDGDLGFRMDKTGRPYVYIRLAKAKWVLLHVYVWQCTFGPVPKGYVVAFKDGNTMDCTPGNLMLLTMKQNMLRNSASMNLSDGYIANCLAWRDKEKAEEFLKQPLLIKLKRESLILNRTIYEQQKIS
jgi:hypothetical protein